MLPKTCFVSKHHDFVSTSFVIIFFDFPLFPIVFLNEFNGLIPLF